MVFLDVVLSLKVMGLFIPILVWMFYGDKVRNFTRRYTTQLLYGRRPAYHFKPLTSIVSWNLPTNHFSKFLGLWDSLVTTPVHTFWSYFLARLVLEQATKEAKTKTKLPTSVTTDYSRGVNFWEALVTLHLPHSYLPTATSSFYSALITVRRFLQGLFETVRQSFGEGWVYIQGMSVALFIDACLTDDEPLWEPVEWSLVQSWIMFIFLFAWIAENLISSRYGSYTGRDKRVWFSWYKTFWLIEGWYLLSLGAASLWVMIPHYYELNYLVSYIVAWWDWYNREFFFALISLYTIVLYLAYDLLIKIRWVHWKKALLAILLINIVLAYLLYVQFFIAFFSYFTGNNWYRKVRLVDYIQMSHEPHRWGYGLGAKSDHFLPHYTKNKFWFKNDGPFASLFLFISLFMVLSLFFLNFFWLSLARKVYATREISFTYTVYCVSALRQFLYFLGFFFLFVSLSYAFIFWRLPIEFYWQHTPTSTAMAVLDLLRQLISDFNCSWTGCKAVSSRVINDWII